MTKKCHRGGGRKRTPVENVLERIDQLELVKKYQQS